MHAESSLIFLELMTRLRVTLEVSARSLHQWKKLFRKEWMWMGNVVMGEDRFPVNSYRHLSRAHLLTMLHQINGSQQIRSQDQCAIKRSSIQRNKNSLIILYSNKGIGGKKFQKS